MPKKSRKRSVSTTPVAAPVAAALSNKTTTRTYSAEFNPDYSYVKQDLKRIGILAGSFFIVLVVLSFFLR